MTDWQPIETAPQWKNVLLFREDAGVMFGRYTNLAEDLMSEADCEASDLSEDELFEMDWWTFSEIGLCRLSDDLEPSQPTHWMPLPAPPYPNMEE
jgi:hypothetical protein